MIGISLQDSYALCEILAASLEHFLAEDAVGALMQTKQKRLLGRKQALENTVGQ